MKVAEDLAPAITLLILGSLDLKIRINYLMLETTASFLPLAATNTVVCVGM